MQALWPTVTVTDDSLKRCVSEIRIALGDESQPAEDSDLSRAFHSR
jgi:DNA-binding winged helix-turn-helix (wHTH) protein